MQKRPTPKKFQQLEDMNLLPPGPIKIWHPVGPNLVDYVNGNYLGTTISSIEVNGHYRLIGSINFPQEFDNWHAAHFHADFQDEAEDNAEDRCETIRILGPHLVKFLNTHKHPDFKKLRGFLAKDLACAGTVLVWYRQIWRLDLEQHDFDYLGEWPLNPGKAVAPSRAQEDAPVKSAKSLVAFLDDDDDDDDVMPFRRAHRMQQGDFQLWYPSPALQAFYAKTYNCKDYAPRNLDELYGGWKHMAHDFKFGYDSDTVSEMLQKIAELKPQWSKIGMDDGGSSYVVPGLVFVEKSRYYFVDIDSLDEPVLHYMFECPRLPRKKLVRKTVSFATAHRNHNWTKRGPVNVWWPTLTTRNTLASNPGYLKSERPTLLPETHVWIGNIRGDIEIILDAALAVEQTANMLAGLNPKILAEHENFTSYAVEGLVLECGGQYFAMDGDGDMHRLWYRVAGKPAVADDEDNWDTVVPDTVKGVTVAPALSVLPYAPVTTTFADCKEVISQYNAGLVTLSELILRIATLTPIQMEVVKMQNSLPSAIGDQVPLPKWDTTVAEATDRAKLN